MEANIQTFKIRIIWCSHLTFNESLARHLLVRHFKPDLWSAGVISGHTILRNCLLEVVSKEVDPEGRHDGADRAGCGGLRAGGGEGAGQHLSTVPAQCTVSSDQFSLHSGVTGDINSK